MFLNKLTGKYLKEKSNKTNVRFEAFFNKTKSKTSKTTIEGRKMRTLTVKWIYVASRIRQNM